MRERAGRKKGSGVRGWDFVVLVNCFLIGTSVGVLGALGRVRVGLVIGFGFSVVEKG